MANLKDKTVVITGSSRGIGLALAKRFAKDGSNLVITGKTTKEHPNLPGTIYTSRDEVENLGANAIAIECDIRFEDQVQNLMAKTVEKFGGIDVLVNNASAISLTPTSKTAMKRYDLMHGVNGRGTFMCSKYALEYLEKSKNPNILNISPPLNLNPRWFANHVAYTMSKYGMSMCTLGMAEELKGKGIKVNSLWPETAIATSAVMNLLGGQEAIDKCRKPEIMADAAYEIITSEDSNMTGNFFIDSELLAKQGTADFSQYAMKEGSQLMRDFFLD